MGAPLIWGILGTGNIAHQFAQGVNASRGTRLGAVGSRTPAGAEAFGRMFTVPDAYPSYEQVLADPRVQAVYISLPNSMHHEWTIKALRAGKHVLCEKPIAVTAGQAQEMFDVAQAAGRVLVEAFMYRAHPQTLAMLDLVRGGAIGRVRLIRTSFCYRTTKIADNVRFSAELAGGALMDVGCYCVNFARLFAGAEPQAIHVTATLHPCGVDEMAAGTLHFPGGVLATFVCGMGVQTDNRALVCGEEGYVETPWPWKPPVDGAEFTIATMPPPRQDKPRVSTPQRQTHVVPSGQPLYAIEADEFAAAVHGEKPAWVTPADSLANMRVLDELRRQAGLNF